MCYKELVDVRVECCLSLEVVLKGRLKNVNTDDEDFINKYLDDYIEDRNNTDEVEDIVTNALESDWEIFNIKFDEIGISILDDEDIFVDVNVEVIIQDYALTDYSQKVEDDVDRYVKFTSNDENVKVRSIYYTKAL